MNKELFDFITANQPMWCAIREKQKAAARLARARVESNRQKAKRHILLLKLNQPPQADASL